MEDRRKKTSAFAGEAEAPFVPHDVIGLTTKTGFIGAGAGLFIASIRNAMSRGNVGAMSVFIRGRGIIGMAAAAPATFAFFFAATSNLRQKTDTWAATFGGFMSGGVLGLPSRRLPVVLGLGAVVGIWQGSFFFLGNRIDSFYDEEDEFQRKEIIRRTTRIPVEQTIAEIGEGPGITPQGYEERRRKRIKEKYGWDINPVDGVLAQPPRSREGRFSTSRAGRPPISPEGAGIRIGGRPVRFARITHTLRD
ncbi:hypothetical protein XA68_10411 [Ophiocordyceps unilateralis]|uniref:Uncharacterized protein n=1 Tax=Ophiocordyceps unilateralis TaxID=268505 RepID=A0A2A9PNP8_OPHUN|nr:hypothetical protein XA68_10411 [Ophiocordyceps unilateralis]